EKVVVKLLDILKQGLGSLVAKTVVATMLVLFGSVRFRSTQKGSLVVNVLLHKRASNRKKRNLEIAVKKSKTVDSKV
ncbi:hypothetical protein HID58_043597, partial [Brassica napus]